MNSERNRVGVIVECAKSKFDKPIVVNLNPDGNYNIDKNSVLATMISSLCPDCDEECPLKDVANYIRRNSIE